MVFYNTIPKFFFFFVSIVSMNLCHAGTVGSSNASRAWGSVEYLYWWGQDSPVSVPLITQNSNPAAFGFINEPGTQIIFGSGSNRDSFNFDGSSGGRATIGGWVDESHRYGLEGSGFGLSQSKDSFSASSIGGQIPVINIPFFSTQSASENVLVNRFPNTALVSDTFQSFGFELNGLHSLRNQLPFPLVFLMGFRYLNIHEDLELNDAVINIPTLPANSVLNVRDDFSTKNNFYGFQVGARTHLVYSKLNFDVATKIALGRNYQKLIISGQTNVNNITIIQPIGLFAEPSNIGSHKNNQFAVVPELQAKIGYDLNQIVRPFITYNCFYINNVIRPGKQIDRNINLSQNSLIGGAGVLSGPAAPVARFHNTGMWIQGISAGIEFNFY